MEYIKVAKIINSHGIKGAVKVYLLTSNVERFKNKCSYYIDKKVEVTVKSVKDLKNNIAILEFNEYNNINDILKFKNLDLYVDENNLDDLDEDEFYIYDLVGLDVIDENENHIGTIKNVLSTLANDVYEVDRNGKIVYIPAVSQFVEEVNLDKKYMKIKLIEGMLDD